MGRGLFAHVAHGPAASTLGGSWTFAQLREVALFLSLSFIYLFFRGGDDNVGGFFCLEFM